MVGGGLFLLFKGTSEVHLRLEGDGHPIIAASDDAALARVIMQIALFDAVFSLDSVVTAVGMVSELPVMIAAVVVAMAVMVLAAGATTTFIERHPTVKMLVLSFLLLIGMTLVADGFGVHVPRGYIYAAIGFSACVEMLNQVASRRQQSRRTRGRAVRALDETS